MFRRLTIPSFVETMIGIGPMEVIIVMMIYTVIFLPLIVVIWWMMRSRKRQHDEIVGRLTRIEAQLQELKR